MSRSDFVRRTRPPSSSPAGLLQRRSNGTDGAVTRQENVAPTLVNDVLRMPGQPLDQSTRSFFEPRFGRSFANVRTHTDASAAASSGAVDAQAYTVGPHIVFGAGRYAPESAKGRALLAHELAHVVQQDGVARAGALEVSPGAGAAEREADVAASRVMAGTTPRLGAVAPGTLQRQPNNPGTMQQNYQAAVASLQSRDADIYGYLRATQLNGGATTVLTGSSTDTSVSPPVTINMTFNLTVRTASLPAPQRAKFNQGSLSLTGSGQSRTLVADMTMDVLQSAAMTPGGLNQDLYHEGLHMLLYIQKLAQPSRPSPHVAALANYRSIASPLPDYAGAEVDIELALRNDWQARNIPNPPNAAKAARETLAHIIEEKYVFDQERAQFGTQTSNTALAQGYLRDAFNDVGARYNAADATIVRAQAEIASVLNEIDRRTAAARAQPTNPQPANPQPTNPPSANPPPTNPPRRTP